MSNQTPRKALRPAPRTPPADDRPVVLGVDDEEALLRVYVRLLTRAGIRVLTASSYFHALEVLGSNRVDLVLTDQRMEGPSGLDLLAKVAERWPRVGRILITALLDADLALRARAHHRVLPKDLSSAMIVDIVYREALRER